MYFIFGIIALNYFLFWLLNQKTGFAADDYVYFFKYYRHYVTPNLTRVSSIGDIIAGMRNHYLYCNGRLPAHFLLQLFLMADKSVFNIVNSLAFCALAFLVYKHANYGKKPKPLLLAAAFSFMWVGFKLFGVTFLWASAAVNYLWTTVFILAFLMVYRIYAENKTIGKHQILKMLSIIPLGMLAGWTNENMGGAAFLAAIGFILYYRCKKLKIPKWSIAGTVSTVVGYLFIMLAPGNSTRISNTKGDTDFWTRFPNTMFVIWNNSWRVLIFIAVVTVIIFITRKLYGKDKQPSDLLLPSIYFLAGVAGAFALLLSPEAPYRAFTGPIVLALTAAFIVLAQLLEKIDFKDCKVITGILIAALAVIFSINIGLYI